MEKKSYIGSVKNTGTQSVKAPYPQGKAKGGKVLKGGDLRTGKEKK